MTNDLEINNAIASITGDRTAPYTNDIGAIRKVCLTHLSRAEQSTFAEALAEISGNNPASGGYYGEIDINWDEIAAIILQNAKQYCMSFLIAKGKATYERKTNTITITL